MRFFSYDGIPAQVIRFVVQLFLLNLLYILFSMPVFTFGAATTALYSVFFSKQKDESMLRRYWGTFQAEFVQSTKIWLVFLLLLLVLLGDFYCLCVYDFFGEGIAWILSVISAVIYLSITAFVFPLQAHYDNPPARTVRNAAVLGVGLIPVGVLINLITLFPVIIYLVSVEVYASVMIWWLPVWFSISSMVNAKILGWVFCKIQPEGKYETSGSEN